MAQKKGYDNSNVSSSFANNNNLAKIASAKGNSPEGRAKAAATKNVNKMIRGDIYNELRKALTEPNGKDKKSYYERFIQKLLKESVDEPNSPVGQLMARQLLQTDILTSLDNQTEKLLSRDKDFLEYRLIKDLFKQQRDVFLDDEIRKKSVFCSRRAGKTECNKRILLKYCSTPNTPCLYINLTFTNAITQCYDQVLEIATEKEMAIDRKSSSEGIIEFANGSSITFRGNSNRAEADKMRGGKYRLIIIDEAGHQCNMEYLIDEVLQPALMDYEDSVIILTGTPPRKKNTYAEKAWNSKEWTNYHWTMLDNPYIKNAYQQIEEIAKAKGISIDSPFIQREYFGVIGAYDTEALVYKDYKVYKEIPKDFIPTHVAIGCDWGYSDYNAIVPLAYNVNTKKAIVYKPKKFNKAPVSYIVEEIRKTFEEVKEYLLKNPEADLNNIGFYCDSNEKSLVYELSQTYGLPAYTCYKYDKANATATLADYCRTGKILIEEDGIIADEFDQTLYKRDEQDNITTEIDDSYHPDAADALLYASRQMFFDFGEDFGGESKDKQNSY